MLNLLNLFAFIRICMNLSTCTIDISHDIPSDRHNVKVNILTRFCTSCNIPNITSNSTICKQHTIAMDHFWNDFHGCECLKHILSATGYDNVPSLILLNDTSLIGLEEFIEKNREILEEKSLKCNHIENYKVEQPFKLLPGHKQLILNWCGGLALKSTSADDTTFSINHPAFKPVLREMIITSLAYHDRPPNIRRFPDFLMKFSVYVYILAGKQSYEVLCSNLMLPQASTILNNIHKNKQRITEGELRCEDLVKHLERSNSPHAVFLSEDGSGIVKRIVYDSSSNQLVGLVLPLSDSNGMPQTFSFQATSADAIKQCIALPKSSLVYVIVAQPLKQGASPFILSIFGTDNKFEASNVLKRWHHIIAELKKHGIEVIGVSSDGDPRLLSAMKAKTKLDLTPKLLADRNITRAICVQDTVHIGTKLRNRLLNSSIVLTIGNYVVTINHIKAVLKEVAKEVHGLVFSDIYPEDRQNFNSLVKIMDDRVLTAIERHVPNSMGTVMYLKICKEITSSFLDEKLTPIERAYKLWHSVYFLRCWRKWLVTNPKSGYTTTENFISGNAYACVELNAHALIDLIIKFRTDEQSNLFLPELFASQPCEYLFRRMRSMGTANYTKINFSLSELLHLISRVEIMTTTAYSEKRIILPRIEAKSIVEATTPNVFPSDEEITHEMEKAQKHALEDAAKFGIHLNASDIMKCEIISSKDDFTRDCFEEIFEPTEGKKDQHTEEIHELDVAENESGRFVELIEDDGSVRNIRKSTLIWMLTETHDKLSSDRNLRVQGGSNVGTNRKKRFRPNEYVDNSHVLIKSKEIGIGDWAVFKSNEVSNQGILKVDGSGETSYYCVGNVLGFKYVDEKNSQKQCKSEVLSTMRDKSKKGAYLVLGIWYNCNEDGNLTLTPNEKKISFPMESYTATMKNPITTMESDTLKFKLPCEFQELLAALNNLS